jgi:hypothetical protein
VPATTVCAVVLGLRGREALAEVLRAVEQQERPADEVIAVPPEEVSGVAAAYLRGIEAALEGESDWLWMLDGTARPEPDALRELASAVESLSSVATPALVASKLTSAAGALDPAAAPMARVTSVDFAFAAYERRLLSVRAVRGGSLLIRRDAAGRHGGPRRELDESGGDLEWTARLLADDVGVLAPASVALSDAHAGDGSDAARLRAATAILFSDAFSAREKLWLAFGAAMEGVDSAGSARAAARVAGSMARGAAAGLKARRAYRGSTTYQEIHGGSP